ncbi:MAG: hypothetical protein J5590_05135 [Clostridia bacterium]|nr:hypothetical protein [Clostridia bacterium]
MYYNNKRLALSIFWIILGAVLIWLGIAGEIDGTYFSGMGGAFTAVGVLQTIRILKYRNDEGYKERIDTELNDERNNFLAMKSWSYTGKIVVLIEGVGMLTAYLLRQETVVQVLSYSVCLLALVYWISYMILSKKY